MFGKLKDKLKKSLSIFSKKAEEEAEVVEEIQEETEPTAEIIEEKEEPIPEQPSAEELIEESKEEKEPEAEKDVKQIIEEEKTPEPVIEKEEPVVEDKEFVEHIEKLTEDIKQGKIPAEALVEETKEEAEDIPPVEIIEKKSFFQKRREKKEEKKRGKEEEKKEKEDIKEEKATTEKIIIEPEEKKSFLGKIKQSVTTKTISAEKFDKLFWELEVVLLENNVSIEVIEKIKEDLAKELVDKPLPRDVPKKIEDTLKNTLSEILTFDKINLIQNKKPLIITFFGINGSGKTTSIAKLTKYFQNNNKSVVLAACDTFRAAAIQQLEEHANKLGVKIIKQDYGSDAAAVAYDAIKYAEKNNIDVVLIDTAGRLHSNTNLMAELDKIIRVTKPDYKIFIGESIAGNDCIEQAKRFNELTEMDGTILTKVDVDDKGGAPLSIAYTIKKPILFLGTGQNYEDLEEFYKEKILHRLF
ncbi:MAG: signal recognition particle-docking protein FtsY [Nanoarchaeota archaeon]|nr:signal recognition particle-docking protein FtsY [Nanoarchaeota archaeon]